MTAFPGGEPPPEEARPPGDVGVYTRAEHMVGDEYALLQIPADERTPEQHARLRALEDELDRIWQLLRRRAEALGRA
jgi:hypothetical protein